MISEPARPKLVTSIKTQLHPASEGAAAIATRHSVFAEDEWGSTQRGGAKQRDNTHDPVFI